MKHIVDLLEEALHEVLAENLLDQEQKEKFSNAIEDIQTELDDIYLESTGDGNEELD